MTLSYLSGKTSDVNLTFPPPKIKVLKENVLSQVHHSKKSNLKIIPYCLHLLEYIYFLSEWDSRACDQF